MSAWVGKYRITLTPFPLHKDSTPSSLTHRVKQSTIPLYGLASFSFYLDVCSRSLTLSMGAAMVLETIPANPPAKKSMKNWVVGLCVIWKV